MKVKTRFATCTRRKLSVVPVLLGLVLVIVGCGSVAQATRTTYEKARHNADGGCQQVRDGHLGQVRNLASPEGQPIVAGPIVVGCSERAGEPVRFIAYVQATANSGKQLCYSLDQTRQKAATGGSCLQLSPSLDRCRESCHLTVVEATVGRPKAKQQLKASLITGAAPGVMKEATLSTAPLRDEKGTAPFIVVLRGKARIQLRLPSDVSLFASFVRPCIPARQVVQAVGHMSGEEEVSFEGSDPFSCRG
jgi:hypothetical protein